MHLLCITLPDLVDVAEVDHAALGHVRRLFAELIAELIAEVFAEVDHARPLLRATF